MPDPSPPRRFRFGAFEADTLTGELRRAGIRIKLNAQPFQVLTLLLTRPGEVLTRDEIARELWPDGTFVDFDHGVNSAINRIREALGDTAANPRFLETLPRRGYRFLAPVTDLTAPTPETPPTPEASPPPEKPEIPKKTESPRPTLLASPAELPDLPHPVVQSLFLAFQLMYLGFYIGALANLAEIEDLFAASTTALAVVIVSATLLIPARAFVLCAVLFRAPYGRTRILQLWRFLLLPADILWSLAPFLLLHHMRFGLALASAALLVYSPFAQRSLVLMGAARPAPASTSPAS